MIVSVVNGQGSWFVKLLGDDGFEICTSEIGNENSTRVLSIPVREIEITGKNMDGLRQANLVLIAYASSEGSGEPAHPRSLARPSAARSYKQ